MEENKQLEQAAAEAAEEQKVDVQPVAAVDAETTIPGNQVAPNVVDTSGDTDGQPAGAHLDAPAAGAAEEVATEAAEPTGDEYADACKAGTPRIALIGKYSDRVPVQIKDAQHLARLQDEHGAGAVEVQS